MLFLLLYIPTIRDMLQEVQGQVLHKNKNASYVSQAGYLSACFQLDLSTLVKRRQED